MKYSWYTHMNNNPHTNNMVEKTGNQSPKRSTFLMSQAEAQNKTIKCTISQQKAQVDQVQEQMHEETERQINLSL